MSLNVYSMFFVNEKKCGFWIQRNSWSNLIARVISIGPWQGPPPYYGNPAVSVDVYKWNNSFREWRLHEENSLLRCPGTHGYKLIPAPKGKVAWVRSIE